MNYMDINKLPSQYTKVYSEIDYDNIMPLYDYHPWNDGKNDKIDRITHTLLNLKNGRTPPVNFFKKVIPKTFNPLMDGSEILFCVVPSHKEGCVSDSLLKLVTEIKPVLGFSNSINLLERTSTVEKAATGGNRDLQHHFDSIALVDGVNLNGETVFLLDDISSTGNSLKACKEILIENGAGKVIMVSLGQTADYT